MESAPPKHFSVRLLPAVVVTLCFAGAISSPIGGIEAGEQAVLCLLQFLVSVISLLVYAQLCRRIFHRKWLTLLAPLSLLIVPLPLYGLLYGAAEWIGLPQLRLMGGDGVFGILSWVCQLALFSTGMIFSGNALLKKAPLFPRSLSISLLCTLGSMIFGSTFFLYGALGAVTDGNWGLLQLMMPPGLLFTLPPAVFLMRLLRER